MNVRTLYFDEGGHTGTNFLDPDQPIFSIGSTDIGDDEAKDILDATFPRSRRSEHRWNGLWRSRDRECLIDLARLIANYPNRILAWYSLKDFVIISKITEYLIEPEFRASDFDFYKDGYARLFANELYYCLLKDLGKKRFRWLLGDYQKYSRKSSLEALSELKVRLIKLKHYSRESSKLFLEMMIDGVDLLPKVTDIAMLKGSDDIYLASMYASVATWRQKYPEDFHVIYDQNAHFHRQADMWEAITSDKALSHVHPLGKGTMVEYSLRVKKTTPINSEISPAIQLCDLVAGFIARAKFPSNTPEEIKFIGKIFDAGFSTVILSGLMPTREFPSSAPSRQIGPDVVDLMTGIIFSSDKMRQKFRSS